MMLGGDGAEFLGCCMASAPITQYSTSTLAPVTAPRHGWHVVIASTPPDSDAHHGTVHAVLRRTFLIAERALPPARRMVGCLRPESGTHDTRAFADYA